MTGEGRAQKPLESIDSHAGAESTRLVVLVPKIKVRRSWDTLEEHTPHRSASSRGFDRCAERHGFLLEIARRWREKAQNFRGAPPRTPLGLAAPDPATTRKVTLHGHLGPLTSAEAAGRPDSGDPTDRLVATVG